MRHPQCPPSSVSASVSSPEFSYVISPIPFLLHLSSYLKKWSVDAIRYSFRWSPLFSRSEICDFRPCVGSFSNVTISGWRYRNKKPVVTPIAKAHPPTEPVDSSATDRNTARFFPHWHGGAHTYRNSIRRAKIPSRRVRLMYLGVEALEIPIEWEFSDTPY